GAACPGRPDVADGHASRAVVSVFGAMAQEVSSEGLRIGERPSPVHHLAGSAGPCTGHDGLSRCARFSMIVPHGDDGENRTEVEGEHRRAPAHPPRTVARHGVGPKRCKNPPWYRPRTLYVERHRRTGTENCDRRVVSPWACRRRRSPGGPPPVCRRPEV